MYGRGGRGEGREGTRDCESDELCSVDDANDGSKSWINPLLVTDEDEDDADEEADVDAGGV